MALKRRSFVERLDFVTSPGHLTGGNARQELGMPGAGPQLVITDKALFDFSNAEREMQTCLALPWRNAGGRARRNGLAGAPGGGADRKPAAN